MSLQNSAHNQICLNTNLLQPYIQEMRSGELTLAAAVNTAVVWTLFAELEGYNARRRGLQRGVKGLSVYITN